MNDFRHFNHLVCPFNGAMELLHSRPQISGDPGCIWVAGFVGIVWVVLKRCSMVGLVILKILASMLKGIKKQNIVLEEGKRISNFFSFQWQKIKGNLEPGRTTLSRSGCPVFCWQQWCCGQAWHTPCQQREQCQCRGFRGRDYRHQCGWVPPSHLNQESGKQQQRRPVAVHSCLENLRKKMWTSNHCNALLVKTHQAEAPSNAPSGHRCCRSVHIGHVPCRQSKSQPGKQRSWNNNSVFSNTWTLGSLFLEQLRYVVSSARATT